MTRRRSTESDGETTVVVKAISVGAGTAEGLQSQGSVGGGDDTLAATFLQQGALIPEHDPESLCHHFEHSNCLRSNVDAYATNIDGFGHRFEPVLDFDAGDLTEKVRDIMEAERFALSPLAASIPISDEDVNARIELYKRMARVEHGKLVDFFESCCFDHSFVDLRRRTRQDLEVTGNGYWEVLRDGRGDIARFIYVPSYTMRLMPLDRVPTMVEETVRVRRVDVDRVPVRRNLRSFVQVVTATGGTFTTYFKTLGDPRVMSRSTGRVFATVEELRAAEPRSEPATEIIHFSIHSPSSPYGTPRWIGNLISVLGSRSMEEVNYLYFGNKGVPPLALIVSGGRIDPDSIPRIERYIEENLKGKTNFHKILILQAQGDGKNAGTQAKIELKPLTEAQQKDELFQQYDERNIDKVGSAFRLPPLLRGDGRDFNRSVAEAQLRFAEDQVFQPERDEFDFMMNRKIFLAMGVRFWKFRSQTLSTRDPERLATLVERMVRVGVITPEEARELAADVFNREFRKINDDWVKRPITLTLAGVQTGVESLDGFEGKPAVPGIPGGTSQKSAVAAARELLGLRDQLNREAEETAARRMRMAREYESTPPEIHEVPVAEMSQWFLENAKGSPR